LSSAVLSSGVTEDGKERISPHGYAVTDDKKLYLRRLCDGPKDAHDLVDDLAADPSVEKAHRPETVVGRLAYLARYGGTAHLVERDERDRYRLTEDGRAIFC
jgi:hypothetical protein